MDAHVADTLAAGAGLCDPDVVRSIVSDGYRAVRELVDDGARFDEATPGQWSLTREGGHSRRRIIHAGGDATGAEVQRALDDAAARLDIRRNHVALEVLHEGGAVTGVLALNDDGPGIVHARSVILATGGLGHLYSATTNPEGSTGDGVALAMWAGLPVSDVEFIQFHPTMLFDGHAGGRRPLITEAVRGEGAVLVDAQGRSVTEGVHPMGDLAPRDIVAAAIDARMTATGEPCVYLDARGIKGFKKRFPTVTAACREAGIDPTRQAIPVVPGAHYSCGGVVTDLHGRTELAGLFAAGEVARTGMHGANRLASNSLLEGLVVGGRAGKAAAAHASDAGPSTAAMPEPDRPTRVAAGGPAAGDDAERIGGPRRRRLAHAVAGPGNRRLTKTQFAQGFRGCRTDDRGWRCRGGRLGADGNTRLPSPCRLSGHRSGDGSQPGARGGVRLMELNADELTEARQVIARALEEDLRYGPDVTTLATVGADATTTASMVVRQPGVIAGVDIALLVLDEVIGSGGYVVKHRVEDGERLEAGGVVLAVEAPTQGLLTAERTMLNLVCHLSGIATTTAAWVAAVEGTDAKIRDTRKTLPGLRALQKYAVRVGGGVNHRMGLGDATLIKDNHVAAAGSVVAALHAVRAVAPDLPCEVEVDSLEQLDEVLAENLGDGALVLLDNFPVWQTQIAVQRRNSASPATKLESSGGLSLDTAAEYAGTGVDYLAVGALTHSVTVLDIGLDL